MPSNVQGLLKAAKDGDLDKVKQLLQYEANVNFESPQVSLEMMCLKRSLISWQLQVTNPIPRFHFRQECSKKWAEMLDLSKNRNPILFAFCLEKS